MKSVFKRPDWGPLVDDGTHVLIVSATGGLGRDLVSLLLEGLLAGVPKFRFRPDDRAAINILPQGFTAEPASIGTLSNALDEATKPVPLDRESVYCPIDQAIWQEELNI